MRADAKRGWCLGAALALAAALLAGLLSAGMRPARALSVTTAFSYTGGVQTYSVPAGVTTVTITAVGA
ncbi:MAG TPA: hypothetical protein VFA70_01725 [Dehalococcoidia bacterium]|nr:hypothetical protein [Dehalococcoidia bacterium]